MAHRVTTSAVQLDARYVAPRLLTKASYSDWTLRWNHANGSQTAITCMVLDRQALFLRYEMNGKHHKHVLNLHHTTGVPGSKHSWFSAREQTPDASAPRKPQYREQ
jgi:hypothetical protein